MATGYLINLGDGTLNPGDSVATSPSSFTIDSNPGSGTVEFTTTFGTVSRFGDYAIGTDGNVYFIPFQPPFGTITSATVTGSPIVSMGSDETVSGSSGDDVIDAAYSGDPDGDVVDANDNSAGTNDDVIAANDGDDTVSAGDGDDIVFGGDGADSVSGGNAADTLYGEQGADVLQGDAGDDAIYGGGGDDQIYGNADNDTGSGGAGDDLIFGGGGVDTLSGGAGSDSIYGGAGDDFIDGGADEFSAPAIVDQNGLSFLVANISSSQSGDGVGDFVVYDNVALTDDGTVIQAKITITSTTDPSLDIDLGYSDQYPVFLNDNGFTPAGEQVGVQIEFFDQSTGLPINLTGNLTVKDVDNQSGVESIEFDAGTFDSISTATTTDISFSEDAGTFTVQSAAYGTSSDENLWVGLNFSAVPTLEFELTNRSAGTGYGFDTEEFSGETVETTTSDPDHDVLHGGAGNDSIIGGAGDDSIFGGADADTISGGDGDDTIVFEDGFGADTIVGGETGESQGDTLGLQSLSTGVDVTLSGPESGTVSDGTDTASFAEIETFELTDHNDTFDGSAATSGVNVDGGGGDDSITGSGTADTIDGGDGADQISAGAGDDAINLGVGDGVADTVVLEDGSGADVITGFVAPTDLGGGAYSGNDQLDVSGLTDADGNPVDVLDVTVSDTNGDGTGDAVLTFPNGERITLLGVAPSAVDSWQELNAMGIPCFTPGTKIETDQGPVRVERLRPGDMVRTVDNGFQPIRWFGARRLSRNELQRAPHLRPVVIRKGALGNTREMRVSPQHGFLLETDSGEQLIRAKHLAEHYGPGVAVEDTSDVSVRYIHLLFDQHEVIFSDGAKSEAFYPGQTALRSLDGSAIGELLSLFPELLHVVFNGKDIEEVYGPPARDYLRARDVNAILPDPWWH